MDNYIGRLLDNRYEILSVLGVGGMAVVYKARCHRLNRLVAIKILKDDFSNDAEFRRRFHAESQAVAMLNHPNIVSVYDVSTNGDADYIVMELVEGITLKQYMERRGGYLNWKESLHFAVQIAKALEHAHNQGIVHRDIKPHNVMILKNGSAKVTDFGIARIMSSQSTLTKEALGSVHYISPEQAKGGRVDNRSDLYSLGVVMYEMLTGQPPYDGESPVAVALKHINGGAPMPSTLNPNIPGGLEQIIMKAMAVDPAQRYASATEMLYDMEEFRKNPAVLFFGANSTAAAPVQEPQYRPAPSAARTAAERAAGAAVPRARTAEQQKARSTQSASRPRGAEPPKPAPRRNEEEEEPKRTSKGMIAAIAAAGVMVVAAIVVLVMLLTGGSEADKLIEVPDLVGQVFNDISPTRYADITLEDDEYAFHDKYAPGEIISQTPKAHEQVKPGTVVKLVISNGPQTGQMLDLVNRTEEKAEDALRGLSELGLTLRFEKEFSNDVEEGRVTRTDPAADETLNKGQTVTLWISKGPRTMVMDDLTGATRDDAESVLKGKEDMNLRVEIEQESSEEIEEGKVIRTDPAKGKTVKAGQTVTLYISTGSDIVMTKVPEVVGLDISKASSLLRDKNLECEYDLVDSDEPKDVVLTQDPKKGTEIAEGTVVKLTVSKGPVETQPPETEPTETEPKAVTKIITLLLPGDITKDYKIQVYQGNTPCVDELPVTAGTEEMPLSLEGTGVQYFDFYVNGTCVDSFRVDFSSETIEKIRLQFTVTE